MNRTRKTFMANRFIFLLLLSVATTGCSESGTKLVQMSGVATFEGKPVPALELRFYPIQGGRPASAITNGLGEFRVAFMQGKYGMLPGEQKVQVRYLDPTATNPRQMPAPYNKIIQKYGDPKRTELTLTIKEDQANYELQLD